MTHFGLLTSCEIANTMNRCLKSCAFANLCIFLKLEHHSNMRKRIVSGKNWCILTPKQRKCILWKLSNIFNASTDLMYWLSRSHLTAFDCPDLAVSGSYWVFFRRQLHNNYAVYWIFKALSRHTSFSCKQRYGKYCLFYIVQACKFVTARFCYRANWTRVGTRIIVLIQTSVCYTRSFTQLTKPISAGVSFRCHSIEF